MSEPPKQSASERSTTSSSKQTKSYSSPPPLSATATTASTASTPNSKTQHRNAIQQQIKHALYKITGYCAQHHKGWWSYEWCHEKGLVQFHIAMKSSARAAAAAAVGAINKMADDLEEEDEKKEGEEEEISFPTVAVESITPLGLFAHRRIVIPKFDDDDDDDGDDGGGGEKANIDTLQDVFLNYDDDTYYDDDDNDDDNEDDNDDEGNDRDHDLKKDDSKTSVTFSPKATSIEIIDTYKDGNFCDESGEYRKVQVHLRCCDPSMLDDAKKSKLEEHQFGRKSGIFDDQVKDTVGTTTRSKENIQVWFQKIDEFKVCEYTATICTTALCDPVKEYYSAHGRHEDVAKVDNMSQSSQKAKGSQSDHSSFHLDVNRDDSIRKILDKALHTGECLTMNAGWWTFGFCHKSILHQYHEEVSLDKLTEKSSSKNESRFLLGKYDKTSSESFPVDKEQEHMYLPYKNKKIIDSESQIDGSIDAEITNKNDNFGAEDPYFSQEYIHGDTCEDIEVVDSAVKGGKYGDEKIERSSTVRFFCGSHKAIIRVHEDSTCHYIVDIAVPELCLQKFYEVPHLKTQVVKCLPFNHN